MLNCMQFLPDRNQYRASALLESGVAPYLFRLFIRPNENSNFEYLLMPFSICFIVSFVIIYFWLYMHTRLDNTPQNSLILWTRWCYLIRCPIRLHIIRKRYNNIAYFVYAFQNVTLNPCRRHHTRVTHFVRSKFKGAFWIQNIYFSFLLL